MTYFDRIQIEKETSLVKKGREIQILCGHFLMLKKMDESSKYNP